MTFALVLGISVWGYAEPSASQNQDSEHRGQGYVFFAPGGIVRDWSKVATAHFGGGGEYLFYQGLGIGAELGYLTPWKDFSSGIGMLSANGSYHFARNQRLSPFLTGGFSVGFRYGIDGLYNFGGGVNYWFRDRLGLRLEFRDHVDAYTNHYLSGRIGLSFR